MGGDHQSGGFLLSSLPSFGALFHRACYSCLTRSTGAGRQAGRIVALLAYTWYSLICCTTSDFSVANRV